MKVLIIGAYGFLGNHILNKLLKEDLYDIHILIKPESKSRFGNHENLCKKHFYGSDNFLKILSEENFEVVINCSVYYGKNENQNQVYETNFLFPTKIIAQLQNSLKLFINFDSYFNKPEFISYNYLENYIKSKSQFVSSIDSKIKYTLERNDKKHNNKIDKLIRNQFISSYMASSLINDIHYKNNLFENLFEISEIIFDNKILKEYSEWKVKNISHIEKWFNNVFGLSDKKIEKTIKKIKHNKKYLEKKIDHESDPKVIKEMKDEIKIIEYTIKKYK